MNSNIHIQTLKKLIKSDYNRNINPETFIIKVGETLLSFANEKKDNCFKDMGDKAYLEENYGLFAMELMLNKNNISTYSFQYDWNITDAFVKLMKGYPEPILESNLNYMLNVALLKYCEKYNGTDNGYRAKTSGNNKYFYIGGGLLGVYLLTKLFK